MFEGTMKCNFWQSDSKNHMESENNKNDILQLIFSKYFNFLTEVRNSWLVSSPSSCAKESVSG
jgi:hypothetical protein